MLVILPYCLRDDQLALELLKWIAALGGCKNHDLVLIHDNRCQKNDVEQILSAGREAFRNVHNYATKAQVDGWPQGANFMFSFAASLASYQTNLKHFMWLEPDAIPLKEGWLDLIEQEYLASGKLFMGDRVEVEQIPLHMSGVGIYPNPIYEYAGEACRAFDQAWDMAARHQIVPKAHFTSLIEHAWKHPTFTDPGELETQIAKETVLFHASKDGSLIKLLRQKKFHGEQPVLGVPEQRTPSGPSEAETKSGVLSAGRRDLRDAPPITCDIFIRTYPKDYPWLEYCLKSIGKFCSGFRKVWIISPSEVPEKIAASLGAFIPVDVQVKVMNDETPDGYLAQQITKLYADTITDYQADYILHVDSDVIITRPITPQTFFAGNGKLRWLYTPYTEILTPWQPIMEKFMGAKVEFEFMRRFPMMFPRWLYPRLREFCHGKHGVVLCDYIRMQPRSAFSEFNALGCYAWEHQHDKFEWVNTIQIDAGISNSRQFRSYDGVTPEVKAEIETILRGTRNTLTKWEEDILYAKAMSQAESNVEASSPVSPVPSQIRELPSGIWESATQSPLNPKVRVLPSRGDGIRRLLIQRE